MLQLFKRKPGSYGLTGVYVGPEYLAIAHVAQRNGAALLTRCEKVSLKGRQPPGEALRKAVESLELQGSRCHFVLGARDYNLHLVERPQVEPQEMRAALRWKVKDLLDTKLDDAALDLFHVPDDAYRGRTQMTYVVASNKARIRSIVDMVTASGLELTVIDIPELVMKTLTSYFLDDEHGLAFIDLHVTHSTMNLTRDGDLYLTRRINTQLDNDVMQSPEWESVRDRLVLEVQRSLDYYESQMGQPQIGQVVVAPRISDSVEIARALDDGLNARVSALDLSEKLDASVSLTPDLQHACMHAIGAALSHFVSETRQAEAA